MMLILNQTFHSVPTPHLDGKHVVFGRVIAGKSIIRQIENTPCDSGDKPLSEVKITQSGQLDLDDPLPVPAGKLEGDVFEDFPDDEESVDETKPETSIEVATKLKEIGAR